MSSLGSGSAPLLALPISPLLPRPERNRHCCISPVAGPEEHLSRLSPCPLSSTLIYDRDPLSTKKNEYFNKNVDRKLSTTTVPTSQVLGRIKDFLGVMAEENKRLELDVQGKSDEHYNIEVLTGNEKEYIEMDLLLGVTDLHTPESVAAAESALAGSHLFFPLSASSESDSEDSEDESDDEDDTCYPY